MRTRRLVACMLLFALGAPSAWGGIDEKEQKRRLRSLKTRTGEFLRARKGLVSRCSTCNGSGKHWKITPGTGGTRNRTVKCDACDGHGNRLSLKYYMKLEFHLKSPAFRLRPDAFANAERSYKSASRRQPPTKVTRTSMKGAALHGDGHGIMRVRENSEKEYRPLLWVWANEPGQTKGAWYLHDASVDGPWPSLSDLQAAAEESEGESFEAGGGEPLDADALQQLAKALGSVSLTFALKDERRDDDTLVLLLEPGTGASKNLRDAVTSDSIALVRTVWGAFPQLDAIHLHYDATFKDRFGNLGKKPYVVVKMDGDTFKKINWATLDESEIFRLFHTDWKHHSGWKVYR